MTWRQASS